MNRLMGIIAICLLLPTVASAADSGQLPWVVWRCDLNDFSGTKDRIIADFESEEEAEEFGRGRYLDDKEDLIFLPMQRTERQEVAATHAVQLPTVSYPIFALVLHSMIDPPLIDPFLDPDVYNSFKQDANDSCLEGRVGIGRVGEEAVQIEFHRANKFLFTKGLEGNGTWEEAANGEVLLTATDAYFHGSLVMRSHIWFGLKPFYDSGDVFSGVSWPYDDLQPPKWFYFAVGSKQTIAGQPCFKVDRLRRGPTRSLRYGQ